jgi:hypothetical protein
MKKENSCDSNIIVTVAQNHRQQLIAILLDRPLLKIVKSYFTTSFATS